MSVFSVPVTIGINEEQIVENIHKDVEAKVISNITNEIRNQISKIIYSQYGGEKVAPLKTMIAKEISESIKDNEDIIIQEAAKLLAEKMSRTKAYKEAIAKVIENLTN